MRNLKRALSLVVASVMLLGMMVVGTSAASFADADEIVNKEAVEITAGLGLFAGSDGKFNPKGNVTRAQMATIIVKMLYGSEINADQFKGTNKFNDTAAFEGGWAEGYINLCANLGIVKGFGDGSFKPGQSLTTAEAVTMIINALKVDAGAGTWPLTVMAKAEEMKLFAELAVKPGTNEALTRDALASVVLEGLQYSPKGTTGYKVEGLNFVFEDIADALQAAKYDPTKITEVVGDDTLANTVFEMVSVSGFVTANQATGYDYTEVAGVALNLETGLDMIGHYVTAYYASEFESEEEPGVAYAIVDEAKYVVVSGDEAVDTQKEYKALFGSKALDLAAKMTYVDGLYNVVGYPYVDDNDTPDNAEDDTEHTFGEVCGYNKATWTAPNGTYVIYEGKIIAYIAGATKILSKVSYVSNIAGKEYIRVAGSPSAITMQNNADEDVVNEYAGIAKDDIVVVECANGIYTLTKAEKIEGKITRTGFVDGVQAITVNGTQYKEYEVDNYAGLKTDIKDNYGASTIDFEATYAVYVADGKYIGWSGITAAANVSDVIYVVGGYELEGTADAYGKKATNIYAQGVDMEGKEVSILVGVNYDDSTPDLGVTAKANVETGFQTFKLATESKAKKAGIMVASALKTPEDENYEDGIYTLALDDTENNVLTSDSVYVDFTIGETADIAFLAPTTKFIVVELTDTENDSTNVGTELDIALYTGLYKEDMAGKEAILSQDAAGNVTLEVVVIDAKAAVTSDDFIYVSEDQANSASGTANGTEQTVYFTGANEDKAIIVAEVYGKGFYTYTIEKNEDGVDEYTLESAEAANIVADETFTRLSGTKLISTTIKALDAANAKVIDARTEDTIKGHDVAEMTMLEDLTAAADANFTVEFTAILDEDLETVTHIFITKVTANDPQ